MAEPFSSDFDRRRARRVRPGPLAVSMASHEGTLVDISEVGACISLSSLQEPVEPLEFVLQWNEEGILLCGRIVRSGARRTEETAPETGRPEHRIAVEFNGLSPQAMDQLRRLLKTAL